MSRATVVASHDEETSGIKNRIHDVEEALHEERKVNMKLRYEAETKLAQIARLDESLAKSTEEHKWSVLYLRRQLTVVEEENVDMNKELDKAIAVITEEISAFSNIEDQNEMLHTRLRDISKTYFEEKSKWDEEIEMAKTLHFDLRMQMDKILRKNLRDLREGYQNRAIDDMGVHVNQARKENEELRRERNKKNVLVNLMMHRQVRGYEKKTRAHIEMEVMATSAQLQQERVKAMSEKVKGQGSHYEDLLLEHEELAVSVRTLKDHYRAKERLSEDLQLAAEAMQSHRHERDQLRHDVIQCCQAMMKDAIYLTEKQRAAESDNLVETVLGPGGLESIDGTGEEGANEDDDATIESYQRELMNMAQNSIQNGQAFPSSLLPSDPEMTWKTPKVDNAMLFSAPLKQFLLKTRRGAGTASKSLTLSM